MNILSIQSHVAYGHVGNAAATFPMQRMGHDVWPIHTVQFSNHTGYGAWRGQVFDAGLIGDCVAGMAERGALDRCDGVLSGYMGSADTGIAILDAVARVRAAHAGALYCCDPRHRRCRPRHLRARGHRRVHARPGAAGRRRRHPQPVRTRPPLRRRHGERGRAAAGPRGAPCQRAARRAGHVLRGRGTRPATRSTSWPRTARRCGGCAPRSWPCRSMAPGTPSRPCSSSPSWRGAPCRTPCPHAASAVFGLLSATLEAGSRELALVAAQDEFVHPTRVFAPERI